MSAPIVVGYDPYDAGEAPVNFGLAAARATGAPVIVAAIYAGASAVERMPDHEFGEELSADARSALDGLQTRLEGESGIRAELQPVEASSAARGLHVLLEDSGAGLAVVGATNRGSVGRRVIGSTAERVIHGAPCPVAVVPADFEQRELRTVAVAYARSDEGEQALLSAVALAHHSGATLRVITVLREKQGTVVMRHASDVGRATQYDEQEAAQHRVAVAQAVESAVAEVAGTGLESEIDLVYGDPAEALLGFTETVDLLVMGSRAYGPQRAVLLGGVSRRVTAAARCPVLVLPRGAEHPLRELLAQAPA